MRLLPLAALAIHLSSFAIEPEQPPSGQNVNESKEIGLRTSATAPCVAYPFGNATVVLQRTELEELARDGAEDSPSAGDGIVKLHRQRARVLLRSQFTEGVVKGCPLANGVPNGGIWLVLRQVELGHAAIIPVDSSEFSPVVVVHYSGSTNGKIGAGFISIRIPGVSRPIYSLPWWIT
ncbi:hypothetical protein WG899_13205 [Paucibacter sp. AS339]|uniref:hypothetical protein n=1 Tax=Paucibacter hankyongi TaxID=3133434 RepID=UPI0030A43715